MKGENDNASFDRDRFLSIANGIHDEVFLTNCFIDLLEQLQFGSENYREEMKCSAAFYNYTYLALITAITMELAKIYDQDGDAISINNLLNMFGKNTDQFPQRLEGPIIVDGKEEIVSFPYTHKFTHEEIDLFRGRSDELAQRVLAAEETSYRIQGLYSVDPVKFMPAIEMTLKDYSALYRLKLKRLETARENLSKQRSKIYAHNDAAACFDIAAIQKEFPLTFDDIKNLTAFASEVSQKMIALCTKVVKADKPINIWCLDSTLKMVRIGEKYLDQYLMDEMGTLQ